MARKRKAVLEKEQQNLKIEYLETKELKRYERNVKIQETLKFILKSRLKNSKPVSGDLAW